MHRALPLLALTIVACKNPERDELISAVDDYDSERSAVVVLLCQCPSLLGYATSDECEADDPPYTASQKECIADAFEGIEDLGIDYLSCVTPLQAELWDCLVGYSGSCEPDWSKTCTDAYVAALADCPKLSSSTSAAVNACVE
jgi:hypothetical protein